MSDLIVDTHVFLWLMEGNATLSRETRALIQEASKENIIFIPVISIWEIAMLQSKSRISLTLPLHQWVEKALSLPALKVVNLSVSIAIESCKLPGEFHGDPADRMIVATSRVLSTPLVTRDKKIIDYGKRGYANVILC